MRASPVLHVGSQLGFMLPCRLRCSITLVATSLLPSGVGRCPGLLKLHCLPAEYAQVLRMLGNGRLEAMCIDGQKRLCHIRGKMRKKVWVNTVSSSHCLMAAAHIMGPLSC